MGFKMLLKVFMVLTKNGELHMFANSNHCITSLG